MSFFRAMRSKLRSYIACPNNCNIHIFHHLLLFLTAYFIFTRAKHNLHNQKYFLLNITIIISPIIAANIYLSVC